MIYTFIFGSPDYSQVHVLHCIINVVPGNACSFQITFNHRPDQLYSNLHAVLYRLMITCDWYVQKHCFIWSMLFVAVCEGGIVYEIAKVITRVFGYACIDFLLWLHLVTNEDSWGKEVAVRFIKMEEPIRTGQASFH